MKYKCYYLTANEKSKQLDRLWSLDADSKRNSGIDIELIHFLRRINKIDGLVTIQSCSGHRGYKGKSTEPAHLWIRLSKKMFNIFEKHVADFSMEYCQVKKYYYFSKKGLDNRTEPGVYPILELWFEGKEINKRTLYVNLEYILKFFQGIVCQEIR